MNGKLVGLSALAWLIPLCGCQTLSGTSWVASEIKIKSTADKAGAAEIRALLIEFGANGALKTTVEQLDGAVRVEHDETYEVIGDKIRIKHPDYVKEVAFQRSADKLFIQSDQYDLTFTPYVRKPPATVATDPAMLRGAEMRPQEYRRVTYKAR